MTLCRMSSGRSSSPAAGSAAPAVRPPAPHHLRPGLPGRGRVHGPHLDPWRLLPARELGCGSPATCWRRFNEWANAGVSINSTFRSWIASASEASWARGHRLAPSPGGRLGRPPGQGPRPPRGCPTAHGRAPPRPGTRAGRTPRSSRADEGRRPGTWHRQAAAPDPEGIGPPLSDGPLVYRWGPGSGLPHRDGRSTGEPRAGPDARLEGAAALSGRQRPGPRRACRR
jgi:hypothetical protein